MLESRDPEAFQQRPGGGFVAGDHWFYFAFDHTLFGYVIWGTPAAADIERLVRLLVRELDRPRHVALVDFEHLEGVAHEAFEALATYTVTHEEALARVVEHTAIVRPRSPVNAAIVAGFFDVASRPFPVSLWATPEEALEHLGRPDASALTQSLRAVRASLSKEPELLRQLRAQLAARPAEGSLEVASRELGMSARTLQRRLAEEGTSFEAQLKEVRLLAAERMLSETAIPVTTLALDLGFRTAQHFSTVFRARTGETPSAFRARRRASGAR